MKHLRHAIPWLTVSVLLATAPAGCGTTRPARFYSLQPLPEVYRPRSREGWDTGVAMGIGPIAVPAYLQRPQIAVVDQDPEVYYSDANRWAAPLEEAIGDVLTQNIGHLLSTHRIGQLQGRRALPADYRIAVRVERFDGVPGKTAVLSARWMVYGRERETLPAIRSSLIELPVTGKGYGPLVEAQSRLLGTLSREIADAVTRLRATAGANAKTE